MPQKIQKLPRLPLAHDYIFKRVFACEGNEDMLKDLLEAILDISIQKIEVKNPELPKNYKEEKKGTLDIKVQLDNDIIIDVEMQVQDEKNIDARSTTYLGKLIANQLHTGEEYTKLKKCIVICILNFEYYQRNSYHNIARMKFEEITKDTYVDLGYEDEDKIASSYIEMHYIEIPKFIKKNPEVRTRLEQWLWLLAGKEEKIEMAEKENKEIKKAVEVLDEVSMNAEERERYESILMEDFFKKQNEIKSFEDGMKKRNLEIAKKLLLENLPIEQIARITELSKEEIEKLK